MIIQYKDIPSPCYVMEENLLKKNIKLIRDISEKTGNEIIFALKSFSMWSVFPLFRDNVPGATASSLYELKLWAENINQKAHIYSPAYDDASFQEIMELSDHITFNSLSQYNRFYPLIKKSGKNISVALRINPEYSEVKEAVYDPCSPGSRLGITVDNLGDKLPEGIDGLHFHTLCESGAQALKNTIKVVEEKFGKYFSQIKWINMGGGHLITDKKYDIPLLISTLKDFNLKYPNLKVYLEPGSAFTWNAGFLKTTVEDIVENHGIKTAIINASFAAHMPDCLEEPYQPEIRNAKMGILPGKSVYRIGGNTCLSGDFYGFWSFDKELEPGDNLIFENMMTYTMVKTTFFNGVKHPSIGMINSDGKFQLIRKFNFEDFKNRLS